MFSCVHLVIDFVRKPLAIPGNQWSIIGKCSSWSHGWELTFGTICISCTFSIFFPSFWVQSRGDAGEDVRNSMTNMTKGSHPRLAVESHGICNTFTITSSHMMQSEEQAKAILKEWPRNDSCHPDLIMPNQVNTCPKMSLRNSLLILDGGLSPILYRSKCDWARSWPHYWLYLVRWIF